MRICDYNGATGITRHAAVTDTMGVRMKLRCIQCGTTYEPRDTRTACECGGLLEVELAPASLTRETFDDRLGALDHPLRSGVWRFRELMPDFPDEVIVSKPEGNTNLYHDQPA